MCELAKAVGRPNDRGFRTCLLENFVLKLDYTLKIPKVQAPADSSYFLLVLVDYILVLVLVLTCYLVLSTSTSSCVLNLKLCFPYLDHALDKGTHV